MHLEDIGWNGFFASQEYTGTPGRVASVSREGFLVWTEAGERPATIGSALRSSGSTWPAIGDWVALNQHAPVIEHVFARRTVLSRRRPGAAVEEQVLAANVDVLFLVSGLDNDYNERRIERYLVVARQCGARPVILLNKADVAASNNIDLPAAVHRLRQWSGGADVLPVSAHSGEGLEHLASRLAGGETAALIGSSGVGKSTIVNRLLGSQLQATGEVRAGDNRGRHTTTTRSLFSMPGGWMLIDMPGLREVQLWASSDRLDAGFDEIQQLAAACRFRNCSHTTEPGCAVLASAPDPHRLANFRKMKAELEFLDRKAGKQLMSETKARWKVIHKDMRHFERGKG
ncbi:MAG TPA: ribosome small subunit-dependent GTPase A [Terracidiphilus sp.]